MNTIEKTFPKSNTIPEDYLLKSPIHQYRISDKWQNS